MSNMQNTLTEIITKIETLDFEQEDKKLLYSTLQALVIKVLTETLDKYGADLTDLPELDDFSQASSTEEMSQQAYTSISEVLGQIEDPKAAQEYFDSRIAEISEQLLSIA